MAQTDPRYKSDVGPIPAMLVGPQLREAIADLEKRFPGLGITLFVFDFGGPGKGLSYISNADRADMVRVVLEWARKQTHGGN